MIGFVIGFISGVMVTVIALSLMTVAKRSDEMDQELFEEHRRKSSFM